MSIHEVFWMEARLLMEFFNKNQERTACADHFTHKRIEYPFPTVGTIDSKSLADQINDQFAHLNYDRRTSEFEKLRIPEMHLVAGALARAVKTFELNLKPAAREIWNQRKTGLQPINPDLLYPQGYGTIVKTNSTATISSFEVSGSTGRAPHPDELKGPAGYPSKTEDGD
jgi:hypothetical protein